MLTLKEKKDLIRGGGCVYPKDNKSYVGVEIECFFDCDRNDIITELARVDLHNNVRFGTDTSIRIEKHGQDTAELRILCKETDFREILDRVLNVLNKLDCKVNWSCGLHVHLDMRQYPLRKDLDLDIEDFWGNIEDSKLAFIYSRFYNCRRILYTVVNRNRIRSAGKGNYKFYLRKMKKTLEESFNSGRENGVCTSSYDEMRTFEIRLYHGTLDYEEMVHWIELLLFIKYNKSAEEKEIKDINDFVKQLNPPVHLVDYCIARGVV